MLLLGTSSEELYLIRRMGKAVSADRLQRSQSVFQGLFQTTAKLIGILPSKDHNAQIVRLIPIPLSHLLIGVGNTASMWSEWSSPGKERLVYEFKLKQLVRNDLRETLGATVSKMCIVDACLMQTEPGANSAKFLVLSVSTDAQADDNADLDSAAQVPCSLWLHTLLIATPPTGVFSGAGDAPAAVLHRILVGENVQFNMLHSVAADGTLSRELGTTPLKPKIVTLLPSWRVYVSWSAHSDTSDAYTLHSAQFDVLNQPELRTLSSALPAYDSAAITDAQMEALRANTAQAAVDSVRCVNWLDTAIASTLVVDTSAVTGQDGVCALLNGE